MKRSLLVIILLTAVRGYSHEIKTNAVYMSDAPEWVTPGRIDTVVEHIQPMMEWDIRRINVYWYTDQAKFEKVHNMGPTVLAFAKKSDNSVHIGPRVNTTNFDKTFGHELVHVISFQKYKDAIPNWLEEGLANHLSQGAKVDYIWLAKQTPIDDVHNLVHPFNGSEDHIRYHYMASQALIEMIAAHCPSLEELLRLSVKRNLENYLSTYCDIKNLNSEFQNWVKAPHKS